MSYIIDKIPTKMQPIELQRWAEARNVKLTNLHEVSHLIDDVEKMFNSKIERRQKKGHQ